MFAVEILALADVGARLLHLKELRRGSVDVLLKSGHPFLRRRIYIDNYLTKELPLDDLL